MTSLERESRVEILFFFSCVGIVLLQYFCSPNLLAFRNVTEPGIYFVLDEVAKIEISDIYLNIIGMRTVKHQGKINCSVTKEYLGPKKRGYYAL